MIKKHWVPFVISSIAFVVITMLTSQFKSARDGFDIVGFPWVYYVHNPWVKYPNATKINYLILLLDFLIIAIPVWAIVFYVRRKRSNNG